MLAWDEMEAHAPGAVRDPDPQVTDLTTSDSDFSHVSPNTPFLSRLPAAVILCERDFKGLGAVVLAMTCCRDSLKSFNRPGVKDSLANFFRHRVPINAVENGVNTLYGRRFSLLEIGLWLTACNMLQWLAVGHCSQYGGQ